MTEAEQRSAGQAVAVDNGGKPTTVISKRIPIARSGGPADDPFGAFQEGDNNVIDLTIDPAGGQAPWSRGQLEVIADVGAVPVDIDWLYLEVNVVGILGAARSVIARFGLSTLKPIGRVVLDHPYDRIAFEAAQAMSNSTDSGPSLASSLGYLVVARLYR